MAGESRSVGTRSVFHVDPEPQRPTDVVIIGHQCLVGTDRRPEGLLRQVGPFEQHRETRRDLVARGQIELRPLQRIGVFPRELAGLEQRPALLIEGKSGLELGVIIEDRRVEDVLGWFTRPSSVRGTSVVADVAV